MLTIIETAAFSHWLQGLKDKATKARLLIRLRKVSLGNLGDTKPVGDGVYEMREFFGPGWRMYYLMSQRTIVVMLGGGDKPSQDRDIQAARKLATEYQNEQVANPDL